MDTELRGAPATEHPHLSTPLGGPSKCPLAQCRNPANCTMCPLTQSGNIGLTSLIFPAAGGHPNGSPLAMCVSVYRPRGLLKCDGCYW